MAKILVTGGLGYIGSHVVVELQENGHEVLIIDNLLNSRIEVLQNITDITGIKPLFEKIDLRDQKKVNLFFKKHTGIDGVIHFAALKSVDDSITNPLLYYENNVNSLVSLLINCSKFSIKSFIFSSSATVYGTTDQLPLTEENEIQIPTSPYGMTKLIGEAIIKDFCSSHSEFNSIILRYFNPIGAHNSNKIGELHLGKPKNLVPFITQSVAGKRGPLQVFGNDYNTQDGTCVRDYIHVVDLAKAHMISVERLIKDNNKENFEVFNIGTGLGSTVLQLIKEFEEVTGEKVDYEIVDRRNGDVAISYADCKKANNMLKWTATHSLKNALLSSWNWEKSIHNN